MWGTFGSHVSILPMHLEHYEKEVPDECHYFNLNKVTHLFDGKDIAIEKVRKDDNLRRSTYSDKVGNAACRTTNFTTGMGISFDHTRAVGGRESEKKIMEWWGSVLPRELPLSHFKNHFKRNNLQDPKPHVRKHASLI